MDPGLVFVVQRKVGDHPDHAEDDRPLRKLLLGKVFSHLPKRVDERRRCFGGDRAAKHLGGRR